MIQSDRDVRFVPIADMVQPVDQLISWFLCTGIQLTKSKSGSLNVLLLKASVGP
jgi:hypothetical protein